MSAAIAAQMIGADFLKVRKRRSTVVWSLLLVLVPLLLFFIVSAAQHGSNPAENGPAGGLRGYQDAVRILAVIFGPLAAILIGTDAGAGDAAAGVFRDLVVTGRSRWGLFFARVPGMLMFWIPLMVVAYAVAVAFDFAFAGGLSTPSTTAVVKDGLWVVFVTSIALCVSLGVSAVIGSRGISIGVLLAWELAATPLLLNISVLGVTRELLLESATRRIQPFFSEDAALGMSLAAAILVLALWIVVPLAAGAWRTATRDV